MVSANSIPAHAERPRGASQQPRTRRVVGTVLVILICSSLSVGQEPQSSSAPAPPPPAPLQTIPRTDLPAHLTAPPQIGLTPGRPIARSYHYFQRADMPPGSIGQAQLLRGGPLPGYFQPVEISAPQGAQLALAMEGTFEPPQPAPLKAGLLVGQVYRLKVTNIPFHEGQEIFPSIEIINRLYPPRGSEARFPIPIQLMREELELALRGQFVIRVIYLENPRIALPRREDPARQRYFEVGPAQDPLEVADGLGRPMAILRIGSRVPETDQATGRFLFDSPPWIRFPEVLTDEPAESSAPESTGPHEATPTEPSVSRAARRFSPQIPAQTRPAGVGVSR